MKIFNLLAEIVQLFWFLKLILLFDAKNHFKMYNAISYWTYIINKDIFVHWLFTNKYDTVQ